MPRSQTKKRKFNYLDFITPEIMVELKQMHEDISRRERHESDRDSYESDCHSDRSIIVEEEVPDVTFADHDCHGFGGAVEKDHQAETASDMESGAYTSNPPFTTETITTEPTVSTSTTTSTTTTTKTQHMLNQEKVFAAWSGLMKALPKAYLAFLGENNGMPTMMNVTSGTRIPCQCSVDYLHLVKMDFFFVSGKVTFYFEYPKYLCQVFLKVCKKEKTLCFVQVVRHCLLLWRK